MAGRLSEGTRVAVIGGGPAGAAFAGSLLASARAFGRRLDVTVYAHPCEHTVEAPCVVDPDARARLTSLGVALPGLPSAREAQGILVHASGTSVLLDPPPGGLMIVDGPGELAGQRYLRQALLNAAVLRGARLVPWWVGEVVPLGSGWVVRAQGASESYAALVGAFGARSELAGDFLEGRYRPPLRMLGSHGRIAWHGRDDLLRVCLAPTPQVDLLVLTPCGETAYVVAAGRDVGPSELANALMVLARDRALPPEPRLLRAERLALSMGPARKLARGACMAVGSAALGSALEPGLRSALLSATRSASALLEVEDLKSLPRKALRSQAELAVAARSQLLALKWARRAGARAPHARARAARRPPVPGGGVLGLPGLTSVGAHLALRRAAVRKLVAEAFAPLPLPFPEPPSTKALVYVVDDDADARSLIEEHLRSSGVAVRAFADELSLLEAAARERPAAVLLDVVLPWVDGFSLCRSLRGYPATAKLRIVAMSGLARRADALAAGADAFLPKPVNLQELDRELSRAFQAGAASGGQLAAARGT